MHFALLFLEFRCHSRIARLSDYRGKTQYITRQELRSLATVYEGEGVRIKGVRLTGVDYIKLVLPISL